MRSVKKRIIKMNINSLKFTGLPVLVALLAIGCANVNYVGKSFEPTTNVDLYFSKEDIEKEYTVMGHAIGSGTSDSNEIQTALIEEAKEKGADAVLITEISNPPLLSSEDSDPKSEVKASFLKYNYSNFSRKYNCLQNYFDFICTLK